MMKLIVCGCGRKHFSNTNIEKACKCGQSIAFVDTTPATNRLTPREIPQRQWPFWATMLKNLRTDGDTGVGDTAQRIAASIGGERFKTLSNQIGLPCKCSERQAEWNRLYPYDEHS